MSKNAIVLEKTALQGSIPSRPEPAREVSSPSEYLQLIRRHFHNRSAIAIVGVGSSQSAGPVCEDIAVELAAAGNRVVIVSVEDLLRIDPAVASQESRYTPGRMPNVWLWPSAANGKAEFRSHSATNPAGNWLNSLRQNFNSILLSCAASETVPAVAELVALADAAMLVVEAGLTSKKQIQRNQYALQLRGVELAGCILINRR